MFYFCKNLIRNNVGWAYLFNKYNFFCYCQAVTDLSFINYLIIFYVLRTGKLFKKFHKTATGASLTNKL